MINITKRGWRHILQHHTGVQSPTHKKKSRFNDHEDLIKLINQAAQYTPVGKIRGNPARIFDAGYPVGIDYRSGKPTSSVTVIIRLNGDLVTMFPGEPKEL
jgi:hypothetical protein